MCHPRVAWREGCFGKGNRPPLLQKCSEIFSGRSKWASVTAGFSESICVFSLPDLGGKAPKTSLATFQTVVKEPGLANLHAYF